MIAAIITAAGSSVRMGGGKKEYLPSGTDSAGRPLSVLGRAALAFAACGRIEIVVITVPDEGEMEARAALPPELLAPGRRPRFLFVPGGPTRRCSVHHGLSLLSAYKPGYVLIHDGARPWVSPALIDRLIDTVREQGAVIPLVSFTDTPKETDSGGRIIRHLRRNRSGGAQTPQAFRFPEILAAHEAAGERELEGREYTDDAEVWAQAEENGPVFTIPGEPGNRKITYPEDLCSGTPREEP